MTASTRIVLLNGVGSVGKSSIARALQKITTKPYLHVAMDDFLAMLPEAYQDHPDGVSFETTMERGKPSVIVRTGIVADRAFSGMRKAIAALASAGNDLIVDEVILGNVTEVILGNVTMEHGNVLSDYKMLLAPFQLHLVGVHASLEILEDRERQRGDRLVGLARWQYDRVHEGIDYDLEIDTEFISPSECAIMIRDRFNL
jgi:chloramphenicol 3-O phosphotransferase